MTALEIDHYDQLILKALQKDGKISNQDLAEKINLSPSPCLRRVRRLEELGLVEGYKAELDAKKLGLTLAAFVQVGMDRHTPERFENFERKIALHSEVQECHLIAGQSADYLMKVIVKDMDAYQHFLLHTLTTIEGVSGVHSSFVLKTPVKKNELPI